MGFSDPAPRRTPTDSRRQLTLQAPGRLHLGFLDPGGTLGRRFGSLGLVVEGFATELRLRGAAADGLAAGSPAAQAELERAASCLHTLRRLTGRDQPLALELLQVLPAHAGLGSGTQLALAVGRAFARWHGLDVGTAQLAAWLGRGLRSGIGIGGFDQGGLLLDGGPGADGGPAPLLSRVALPPAWQIVLVLDERLQGLAGGQERQALAALPPLPQAAAAAICHQVLMRVLPGAASEDFEPFAAGVTTVQQLLGEHFAPAQGGQRYTSADVGRVIEWIGAATIAGTGQSSWGPTGFALLPSRDEAESVVAAAHAAGVVDPALSIRIVRGRNRGAQITELPAPAGAD